MEQPMPHIQFGYIMPADRRHYSGQATFVADLNRALDLVSDHFDSAWMVDHLHIISSVPVLAATFASRSPIGSPWRST